MHHILELVVGVVLVFGFLIWISTTARSNADSISYKEGPEKDELESEFSVNEDEVEERLQNSLADLRTDQEHRIAQELVKSGKVHCPGYTRLDTDRILKEEHSRRLLQLAQIRADRTARIVKKEAEVAESPYLKDQIKADVVRSSEYTNTLAEIQDERLDRLISLSNQAQKEAEEGKKLDLRT